MALGAVILQLSSGRSTRLLEAHDKRKVKRESWVVSLILCVLRHSLERQRSERL